MPGEVDDGGGSARPKITEGSTSSRPLLGEIHAKQTPEPVNESARFRLLGIQHSMFHCFMQLRPRLVLPCEPSVNHGLRLVDILEQVWIAHIPVSVAGPAVAQPRLALKAHEAAVQAGSARLNEESAAWARWMSEHPAWDPGVWGALDAEEKRLRAKAGPGTPPRSVSTWRDERASDGARRALFRKGIIYGVAQPALNRLWKTA